MLNSSHIDIYVKPDLIEFEKRNMSVLNCTWNASYFENRYLYIKVNFSFPILISPHHVQDSLIVHFKDPNMLYSSYVSNILHNSSQTLLKSIPKQVVDNSLSRGALKASNTATTGVKILFIVGFLLNLIFLSSSKYLSIMVKALQMILHLPILFFLVPGNIILVFRIIIAIAMFDIFENDYGIGPALLLDFDDVG